MAELRFSAVLGTMDEFDILPASIEHARSIGVTQVIVLDYGSTDGSLSYLADAEAKGDIWLLHVGADDPYDQWELIEARLARASGSDWVLFMDADEFWLPEGGSLHDLPELAEADVLSVMRYNVVLGPNGPEMPGALTAERYEDVLVHAEPIPDWQAFMEEHPEAAWIEGALEPKVMTRPAAARRMLAGDHDVELAPGAAWRKAVARQIMIAHVPFRSRRQFEHKAANIRAAVEATPEWYRGGQGWQWSRWALASAEGQAGAEYERQALTASEMTARRASGLIRPASEILGHAITAIDTQEQYSIAAGRSQPWLSAAGAAFRKHGINADSRLSIVTGLEVPTVVVRPDHMVQFYGPWGPGHEAQDREGLGLELAARTVKLQVPRQVASGALGDWRYVVRTRPPGPMLGELRSELDDDGLLDAARRLGQFVHRLHATPVEPASSSAMTERFQSHIEQQHANTHFRLDDTGALAAPFRDVERWLPPLSEMLAWPHHAVLLHGDLDDRHVLGRVVARKFLPSGISGMEHVAFGHPLYELGPIWASIAGGQVHLMRSFLEGALLPGYDEPGFSRMALAWCLLHPQIPSYLRGASWLTGSRTLDELADRSFGDLVGIGAQASRPDSPSAASPES